ncbi:MAG TPA: TMEM175 family protein [Galbitalea sp.]|jgi:uncharacterized membrane protein|nr:TMEM175 family protein [Galbitalea sp.]
MEAELDENPRGIERVIFFTDAVVAIAITLLILPLVEIVTNDNTANIPLPTLIYDNLSQMFGFALSFLIIARLWIGNHEILLSTAKSTGALIWIDIAWAFTIVVIPLPTEITAVYDASLLTVTIYIACGFASTLALTGLCYYLYRHPELQKRGHPISAVQLWGVGITSGAFILAFLLAVLIPPIHYYSMFALALTWPADAIMKPRIRKREAARLAKS